MLSLSADGRLVAAGTLSLGVVGGVSRVTDRAGVSALEAGGAVGFKTVGLAAGTEKALADTGKLSLIGGGGGDIITTDGALSGASRGSGDAGTSIIKLSSSRIESGNRISITAGNWSGGTCVFSKLTRTWRMATLVMGSPV